MGYASKVTKIFQIRSWFQWRRRWRAVMSLRLQHSLPGISQLVPYGEEEFVLASMLIILKSREGLVWFLAIVNTSR